MLADDATDTGERSIALETHNQLSLNQLSLNQLALDQLALDQLSTGPIAGQDFEFSHNGMEQTEGGRSVISYAVRCALAPAQRLVVHAGNTDHVFQGLFGLAPGWLGRPIDATERGWVSACMLAHVNAYGVPVAISVRAAGGVAPADAAEMSAFPIYEGTFFGDIFGSEIAMYACGGARQEVAASHGPSRDVRVCTDDTPDCGITALGSCRAVCDARTAKYGASQCQADGVQYPAAVSVWLHDPDTDHGNAACPAGGTCDLACDGVACSSSNFDCAGSDDCAATCTGGATCSTDCADAAHCDVSCDGALCDVDCLDAGTCAAACAGGSDCEIDCAGTNDCAQVECTGGSACLLDCDGAGGACGFAECTGGSGVEVCAGGVVVCNRECP